MRQKIFPLFALVLGLFLTMFSSVSFAGTVHSCSEQIKKVSSDGDAKKITRCVIELTHGGIGDVVEIKNEYNYVVAVGKIVNKKGRYAVVFLKEIYREVKSGYPVILRNNDGIDFLTATMAPF